MALTEAERKLLDELEATLTAQDPKLASKFTQAPRRVHPWRVIVGALGFLAGVVALVAGMSTHWSISVIGFVVMLASAFLLVTSWQGGPGRMRPASPPAPGEDFLSRLEKRWQDRQGQ